MRQTVSAITDGSQNLKKEILYMSKHLTCEKNNGFFSWKTLTVKFLSFYTMVIIIDKRIVIYNK